MKHSPKVMIWGTFSATGRGALYFVPQNKTVTADEYLNILRSKLLLSINIHNCTVFQHDSGPTHAAKKVKDWLRGNEVQVLNWPGNSPDLNLIENLWMLLKRKVRQHNPKSPQELMYFIKRTWCNEISADVYQKLMSSMPNRLRNVIKNKGYSTKY